MAIVGRSGDEGGVVSGDGCVEKSEVYKAVAARIFYYARHARFGQ